MRTLKLLLTDKYYRWATLEKFKLRLLSIPTIKHTVAWFYAYKLYVKMRGKNKWEKYVEIKNMENDLKKFYFVAKLIRLEACIINKCSTEEVKEMFNQTKSAILRNEMINEPYLKEFKSWLESIDSSETDYSRIRELINSYTSKQN